MTESADHTKEVLSDLRTRYPSTPFLALGQTVWWDEPMKAVLRVLLDRSGLGGRMVLGVHDTDYFAKLHTRVAGQARFELLPHNDGHTKDLWSAAGEIARFLGSECLTPRVELVRHGVPFHRLAAHAGSDRLQFVDAWTEAWGWRGLVQTAACDCTVNELLLQDVSDGIQRMLAFGFDGTIDSLATPEVAASARRIAQSLLEQCCMCCRDRPGATLTTLYQHMLPRLFRLVMDRPLQDATVTSSTELLRFTRCTALLPRFAIVDTFLQPPTRRLAAEAYNAAVRGSEMYELDRFGLGALPFDVVIAGRGRGTLRVTLRAVHIETREPIRIRTRHPVESVLQLAEVLDEHLPGPVVLVGKAVALIAMLAREFIFVFNEEGSAYVRRTRDLHQRLATAGIPVPVHPILRMHYSTWSSAEGISTTLRLPEHMQRPFGAEHMTLDELARRWTSVSADQEALLAVIRSIRSPRRLMEYLARRAPGHWSERLMEHAQAKERLRRLRAQGVVLHERTQALYAELRQVRRDICRLEREHSAHLHSVEVWSETARAQREDIGNAIRRSLERRRSVMAEIRAVKSERLALERGEEAMLLRRRIDQIEVEAEMERMLLVREALLTTTGLKHTDHRPTAWWIPFADPSGHWFGRIVDTTQLYVEPLT